MQYTTSILRLRARQKNESKWKFVSWNRQNQKQLWWTRTCKVWYMASNHALNMCCNFKCWVQCLHWHEGFYIRCIIYNTTGLVFYVRLVLMMGHWDCSDQKLYYEYGHFSCLMRTDEFLILDGGQSFIEIKGAKSLCWLYRFILQL